MKRVLLISMFMLLSGCGLWSALEDAVPDYNPDGLEEEELKKEKSEPAKLTSFDQEVHPVKLWSTRAVGDYESVGTGLQPVLGHGKIYVADSEGSIVAIDAGSGKKVWKVALDTPLGGGVGIGGELVFVGSSNGDVIALEAETGTERWRTQLSSEILAAPSGNGDIVVAQVQDGRIVGLDAQSGMERWQFEIEVPVLSLRGTSAPLVEGNTVIAGFANGKVYAFAAATGDMMWENRITVPQGRSELERMVDIDGQPLLVGDIVYAAGYQGRIGAVSRTGRGIWYQDVSSVHGPAHGLQQIYVAEVDGQVKAMRATSGRVLWTNNQLSHRTLNRPSVAGGYLLVADIQGYLHILSQTDGHFVGRTRVDSSGVSAPMVTDGDIIYILDNDGGVSAYKFE
ncbi:MAG: outer membrane protein assembly factor BamB [Porticoccus sp.]|nr:outer membrane protein assembly factor BamB [Porticoccus sp.]